MEIKCYIAENVIIELFNFRYSINRNKFRCSASISDADMVKIDGAIIPTAGTVDLSSIM